MVCINSFQTGSPYSLRWPWTHFAVEDGLELLAPIPPPPECLRWRLAASCLVCVMLGIKFKDSCMQTLHTELQPSPGLALKWFAKAHVFKNRAFCLPIALMTSLTSRRRWSVQSLNLSTAFSDPKTWCFFLSSRGGHIEGKWQETCPYQSQWEEALECVCVLCVMCFVCIYVCVHVSV